MKRGRPTPAAMVLALRLAPCMGTIRSTIMPLGGRRAR